MKKRIAYDIALADPEYRWTEEALDIGDVVGNRGCSCKTCFVNAISARTSPITIIQ